MIYWIYCHLSKVLYIPPKVVQYILQLLHCPLLLARHVSFTLHLDVKHMLTL